jgi:hypothetical protein
MMMFQWKASILNDDSIAVEEGIAMMLSFSMVEST